MEVDKKIILKMIKDFVYHNPKYDNISVAEKYAFVTAISGVELCDVLFVDDAKAQVVGDMYGKMYVKGSGGCIDIWVKIIHDIYQPEKSKNRREQREFFRIFCCDYLSELRNQTISNMGISITDSIKSSLDEYLEFDSSELFNSGDLIRVFGGAIRDIIADMPINDIDIICGSVSAKRLKTLLESKGYKYMESLTPKDLSSVYSDIKIICEPHTYLKGDKIVQLIRPRPEKFTRVVKPEPNPYEVAIHELIKNVDISCCGVSYDGVDLIEDVEDAVLHCRFKMFEVNNSAKMTHRDRIIHRKYKLSDRGWEEITDQNRVSMERELKVNSILDDGYFDFIKSWEGPF